MFNQIQSLSEVVDKIDSKEEMFERKFDLERSFSVSVATPAGSPYTNKSRQKLYTKKLTLIPKNRILFLPLLSLKQYISVPVEFLTSGASPANPEILFPPGILL